MAKNAKFETEGYTIYVKAKNFVLTDAIRDYVFEKLDRIERFSKDVLDIDVTLDVQKLEHSANILMNFLHFQIRAHASTDTVYSAIDKAVDRLVRMIKKYKGQLEDHRATNMGTIDLNVNVLQPQRDEVAAINDDIEAENWKRDNEPFRIHEVVAKDVIQVRMLTQDEAVMDMELSGRDFMIYKCEEDQKLKVIYRREDENFGLIEVEKP